MVLTWLLIYYQMLCTAYSNWLIVSLRFQCLKLKNWLMNNSQQLWQNTARVRISPNTCLPVVSLQSMMGHNNRTEQMFTFAQSAIIVSCSIVNIWIFNQSNQHITILHRIRYSAVIFFHSSTICTVRNQSL